MVRYTTLKPFLVKFASIIQLFNTIETIFDKFFFWNYNYLMKYSIIQKKIGKNWLHLEKYTKNCIFGPNLPRLPK